MDPHRITREERIVIVAGAEVKLTDLELRLEAVRYVFKPDSAGAGWTLYAAPAAVLASRRPEVEFQASPALYQSMRKRAQRIQALLAGGNVSQLKSGLSPQVIPFPTFKVKTSRV